MNFKKIIAKKIGISAILIAIFLIPMFILKSDIEKRAIDVINKKEQINTSSENIGSLAYLKIDSETAKKYLSQISTYLINKDQLLNFSNDIGLMSKQNNLNFLIAFGQEKPLAALTPRSTNISLSSQSQANIDNLVKFLGLVENSRYFVRLENMDVSQEGSQLKVTTSGKVFSF